MLRDTVNLFISSFLRQKRIENGLSQLEFANLLGMSSQAISNIERNYSPFPRKRAQKLYKVLNLTEEEIYNALIEYLENSKSSRKKIKKEKFRKNKKVYLLPRTYSEWDFN